MNQQVSFHLQSCRVKFEVNEKERGLLKFLMIMDPRYVVQNGYTLLIQPSLGNRQLETVENVPTDNMNSANSIV